jgi:hypothetical protein
MSRMPALLFVGILLTGCAQATAFVRPESAPSRAVEARVLVMPPDLELYELTVGGLLEPKAEWTARATEHVTAALKEESAAKNVRLILYTPPAQNSPKEYAHNQLVKLHDAVGGAILVHQYNPGFRLPTKKDKFDWSLGPGVGLLREDYNADYGLFIFIRDSYASAGRIATAIVVAALGGLAAPGGTQVAFASLVDLKTGDILWFNQLVNPTGDLRDLDPARKAVKALLMDIPL